MSSRFLPRIVFLVSIVAVFLSMSFGTVNAQTVQSAADALITHDASTQGLSPLSFSANVEQRSSDFRFETHFNNWTALFGPGGFSLTTLADPNSADQMAMPCDNPNMRQSSKLAIRTPVTLQIVIQDVTGIPSITGIRQQSGDMPVSAVLQSSIDAGYAGLTYGSLYPGVAMKYSGETGTLSATYTLAAGVNPAVIRWRYMGGSVSVNSITGNLEIYAPDDVALIQKYPTAWQTWNGTEYPVRIGYQIGADGDIRFVAALGSYDPVLPLTIQTSFS